jgi:hypothetical protein
MSASERHSRAAEGSPGFVWGSCSAALGRGYKRRISAGRALKIVAAAAILLAAVAAVGALSFAWGSFSAALTRDYDSRMRAGAPAFSWGSGSTVLGRGYESRPSTAAGAPGLAQTILPGDGFAVGWKKSAPLRTFISQDLFNHIDGGAELFLEFGFARLFVQAYGDGVSELTAAVYEMESATAALSIYLMKMGKETPFPEIAARNSSEDAQLTIVKGRYFIQIDNFGDKPAPRSTAVSLAKALLASLSDDKPESILNRLPAENRIPGSERLIRGPYGLQPYFTFGEGDVLQLDGKIFAALAEYTAADGSKYSRLIIPYPDGSAAAAALVYLRANLDPYLNVVETSPSGFAFIDFQKKYGTVALAGNVLDIRFKMLKLDFKIPVLD